MEQSLTAADVVDNIVGGDPLAAKTAFDALVTARIGEKIEELKPSVAASLFGPDEAEDEDDDHDFDSEEEEVDGDQLQADEE
jgi:hypothetical protein